MPGLVPGIHAGPDIDNQPVETEMFRPNRQAALRKRTWMAGTSPAMTERADSYFQLTLPSSLWAGRLRSVGLRCLMDVND